LFGDFHADMALHHTVCLAFIALTLGVYNALPSADLVVWSVIWDSISRMLASSVWLNLRAFHRESLWLSSLFAVTFLCVRVVEQVPFVAELAVRAQVALNGSALSVGTGVVSGCWLLLSMLNGYWSLQVVKMVIRRVAGSGTKTAHQSKTR